jgi:hypothetical protein
LSSRPDLIYVFTDQLRYQSLGYAGDVNEGGYDSVAKRLSTIIYVLSGKPKQLPHTQLWDSRLGCHDWRDAVLPIS